MELSADLKHALGVALNEATLLGIELDAHNRRVGATLAVLTLPADGGPMPRDPRVQFVFAPVGRVVASLRQGRWDDPAAHVVPITGDQLLDVVRSFGGLPVYGWEFFDTAESKLEKLGRRLSLDWRGGNDGMAHSVRFFQAGPDRHLDVIIWFDWFTVRDHAGREISLAEFTAGGKRWWDAFYDHDPRTQGMGMSPLS
jgi:hypothetical protein